MLCLLFFWANAAVPLVASVHAAAQDAPPASLPAGEPAAQVERDSPAAPRAIDAARIAPTTVTDPAAAVTPAEPLAAQAKQSGGAAHATPALGGAVDAPVSDGLALGVGRRLRWQPVGVLRLKTALVQNDPNVQFIGRADGFSLQNARVGVRGQFDNRVRIELSVDGAMDERANPNDPNGELRVGLRDAYADVALGTSLAGLSLRAGRFLVAMDADNRIAINHRVFVDRALLNRGVVATEGWQTNGLVPTRSLGMALRWEPQQTSGVAPAFEVAVQNGAGEFAAANDNDAFAISGVGLLRLPHDGFVSVAAQWNPRTVGTLPFTQDQTDLTGAVAARWGGPTLEVVGAALLTRTTFATTAGPTQTAWGAQLQGRYALPLEVPLGLAYRFAILDPSNLVLTDRVMEHTGGLTLGIPALRLRALLNFTHVAEQAERRLANDRVEAVFEVIL